MKETALRFLQKALANPDAEFRDGQWESIEALLAHKRMLVVQRTGWGKSMVYFLAAKLMREEGGGPTLLISPLLSLMRNQLEAAARIGVRARTINSTNSDEWEQIHAELRAGKIDLLLISPERLANDKFRKEILADIADKIGLFVIDEAHCISDWGHDFRPDYQRIVRVLQALPPNIPVLATTATANDRVVKDIVSQLGDDIEVQRGPLVRESLKLQNITMHSAAARMAWLAETIPTLPGSGIVYTLTQKDAERVSEWLQLNNINAQAYHSGISRGGSKSSAKGSAKKSDAGAIKETLEQELLNNQLKVLVATVALGMGFDKPDLGFVIHFQRPSSVVHYYQQVGRAGRAVDEAYGILLHGEEDDAIADFFIRAAFPPQQHINDIFEILDNSDDGLSLPQIQRHLNLSYSQLDKAIKFLTVEATSPIAKVGSKWSLTAAAASYEINQEHIDAITQIRHQEQSQMQSYMTHTGCLMEFLEDALDDAQPHPCGKCKNCAPDLLLPEHYDEELMGRATLFVQRSHLPIEPRKKWPAKEMFKDYDFEKANIPAELQAFEGRSLSLWRDAGWGETVAKNRTNAQRFDDALVDACVEMFKKWNPHPAPNWVTCVPSLAHPELVPDFAARLASALNLPFKPVIQKIIDNPQQRVMENSFQRAKNLDGVFRIALASERKYGPVLLIDDVVDSRWTLTVAAALLRQAGCSAVLPLTLAVNSTGMK